jgi:hypothetical protein
LKTNRADVKAPDSIGVQLRKGAQEGTLVLFDGGWADLLYWGGSASDDVIDEAPGWEDWLDIEHFGALLDRFAGLFK